MPGPASDSGTSSRAALRGGGHRSDVHSLCFFRFRAWFLRQMINNVPRWSSPRKDAHVPRE
eukprot:1278028-Pyramimonas_sp.AAC.1